MNVPTAPITMKDLLATMPNPTTVIHVPKEVSDGA